jgi:hypothetical protein
MVGLLALAVAKAMMKIIATDFISRILLIG